MTEEQLIIIGEIINKWKDDKFYFTFAQKQSAILKKGPVTGETEIIYFEISVDSFLYKGEDIPLKLSSKPFSLNELRIENLPDNIDSHPLKTFLEEFDEEFHSMVVSKLSEYGEGVMTRDPRHFK